MRSLALSRENERVCFSHGINLNHDGNNACDETHVESDKNACHEH